MVMRVPAWEQYGWLRHGFSTRAGGISSVYGSGGLNLGFTPDDEPSRVRENRRRVATAIAGAPVELVAVRQVHGTRVRRVGGDHAAFADAEGRATVEADGLMTSLAGMLLGVQAADCVPVLVADLRLRVVAAFHAGWRGTVQRIVEQGIGQMTQEFGCRPEDLAAAVGPSIRRCCYNVGPEVRTNFESAFPYGAELLTEREGSVYLDLAEANRRQLVDAGLRAEAVHVLDECTACQLTEQGQRRYFSHRVEHGVTGRTMGLIGLAV